MAQIDFIATWKDALLLLERMVANPTTKVFPDVEYKSQTPTLLSSVATIREPFGSPNSVYIWSSDISPIPPQLTLAKQVANPGKYWLSPADAQPLFRLIAYSPAEVGGVKKLYPGSISWKTHFLDPLDSTLRPMRSAGAKLLSDIRKIVKSEMHRIKLFEPTWIGNDARQMFNDGNLVLVDCGREFWMNKSGTLEMRESQTQIAAKKTDNLS